MGRSDCTGEVRRFASLAEAEAHIAVIAKTDPAGVERGDYYVDGPEELINPRPARARPDDPLDRIKAQLDQIARERGQ